jgi:hypothetical protein
MVEIKSYPAKNGDAFLVNATDGSFAMLVDGGYAETYGTHLEPDLKLLAAKGRWLDLVVATHVDADHISGLLPFFRRNGPAATPAIIPVRGVLHNSLRSLISPAEGQGTLRPDDAELLREIRQRGFPARVTAAQQEISARQGNSLSGLLRTGAYRWNNGDGHQPVGRDRLSPFEFPGVRVQVISPSNERLEALKKWWVATLRRQGFVGPLSELDDIFEFLCAHETPAPVARAIASSDADLSLVHLPDDSVTNGSSISMVVKVGGCRLLLLADAWAADVVDALKPAGSSVFSAIKIAHHGSARNTSPELLGLVDAPHYFISTNGDGHEHPDFAVLRAIVDRPTTFKRTLHFNYPTPASHRLKSYRSVSGAAFDVQEGGLDWVQLPGGTQS